MHEQESKTVFECPSADISMYIDGELSPDSEAALEVHLLDCAVCRAELNDQKAFLLALSESLENEDEIDLPGNFAKSIVIKAESGVSGLRVRSERVTAIVVISLLFLFVVIVLGNETANAFAPVASILERAGSVLSLAGHLAYNFAYGVTVFLRSAVTNIAAGGFIVYLLVAIAFAAFLFVLSRQFRRLFRA
jgi:predicted anti-sigma-YlaC factor YlaD